jgi:hypothetical protein
MNFNDVALALAGCAESVGLTGYDYVPDDMPNMGFYVGEMDLDPNQTFGSRSGTRRGTDQGVITCRVLVARSTDKWAVRKVRDYASGSGPKSLIQAIQADKTLDGSVHSSIVRQVRFNRLFTVGEKKFYGVEIDVFVIGDAS